jgi:hypothetical protein
MAAKIPQYRKTPGFDMSPGSVILGSILRLPQFPEEILNKGQIIPIDPTPTPHTQSNYKETVKKAKKGKIGIWARVVKSVGAGAEVGAGANNTDDYEYSFEKLETTSFYPDPAYIEEAIKKSRMKMYLEGSENAPVYMVTGVKVVRGANSIVKTKMAKGREAHAYCGISATVFGSPVNIGPSIDGSKSRTHEVSFGGSTDAGDISDFVIGYRLRIITFEKKDDQLVTTSESYLDGATMADGTEEHGESPPMPAVVHVDDNTVAEERAWDKSD